MKKVLPFIILCLFIGPALSGEKFDKMSISEIYNRGYIINAEVSQEMGVIVKKRDTNVAVSGEGYKCTLKVRTAPSRKSMIRKGTRFDLIEHRMGFHERQIDGLYADVESKYVGIDYYGDGASSLEQVKQWCAKLKFRVTEGFFPEY